MNRETFDKLVVGVWTWTILGTLICSVFVTPIVMYYYFNTWIFYVILTYFAWELYDFNTCNTGGRRKQWLQNWQLWRIYKNYFPVTLVKHGDFELDPARNYLFVAHPHGSLCVGVICTFIAETREFHATFPNFTPYVASLKWNFMVPFVREYILGMGSINASETSLNYVLNDGKTAGNVVVLVVGGMREQNYVIPERYCFVLKRRKGFIRVALKNGSPVVPVISFGENDIFHSYPHEFDSYFRRVQTFIKKKLNFLAVLILGRQFREYTFGLMPRNVPVTVVVGEPMNVPRINEPTNQDVDKFHNNYVKRVIQLFEANKGKYLKNAECARVELV